MPGWTGCSRWARTGEGMLLSVEERKRVISLIVAARPAAFRIVVHAGAQTTSETVRLAEYAAAAGPTASR